MRPDEAGALGVVILAGGAASRLPGKLELDAGGVPLIVRVFENIRQAGTVYVSAAGTFAPQIDAALDCPIIVDRWPQRGPLAALYATLSQVTQPWVFVTAADTPFVSIAAIDELRAAWEPGMQAVVPINKHDITEPLCALYDRNALLEAAGAALACGSGGVTSALERLTVKRIRLTDERVFASVNTERDRTSLLNV